MALPIVLKHFPTAGLPKGFYRIEGIEHISVQTRAGARARAALVIREHGRAGVGYFVQDGNRWVCVRWGDTWAQEITLGDLPEEAQLRDLQECAGDAMRAGFEAELDARDAKPVKGGKPYEIKYLNGKPYQVYADGRWVAIEGPAPVCFG